MTARGIDLAALKALLRDDSGSWAAHWTGHVSAGEVLALVEAVEAAHAALEFVDPYAEFGRDSEAAAARLAEALSRFDFGEPR